MPAEAIEAIAVLVNPFPGSLTSPQRVGKWPLTNPLTYSFSLEYRAWVEVIPLHFRSRGLMVLAREMLVRALFEGWLAASPTLDRAELVAGAEPEKAAREAKRRRRAWMTVNGTRYLGVGADGDEYRSVVVRVGEQFVAAVVPTPQKEIVLRLTNVQTNFKEHCAGGNASRTEVAGA